MWSLTKAIELKESYSPIVFCDTGNKQGDLICTLNAYYFFTGTSKLWILEKKIIITSFILHYLVLKYRKYLFKSSKNTCFTQNHA